jgi:hypothetical protein
MGRIIMLADGNIMAFETRLMFKKRRLNGTQSVRVIRRSQPSYGFIVGIGEGGGVGGGDGGGVGSCGVGRGVGCQKQISRVSHVSRWLQLFNSSSAGILNRKRILFISLGKPASKITPTGFVMTSRVSSNQA